MEARSPSNPVKWLVAVDGSVLSRKAYETALYLMPRDVPAQLVVVHIGDGFDEAEKRPLQFQPEHILGVYEQNLIEHKETMPYLSTEVRLVYRKLKEQHVYDVLQEVLEEVDPHFVVLGYFGVGQIPVRGSQTNLASSPEAREKLGSIADLVTRKSKATAVIVKKGADFPDEEKGSKLMIAVDGSEASKIAFDVAMNFLSSNSSGQPSELIVTHFSKNDFPSAQDEALTREYRTLLEQHSKVGSVKCVPRNPNAAMNIGYDISEEAHRQNVDYLIIGSVGLSGAKPVPALGSVANHCVRFSKCHTIICKLSSKTE